MARTTHKISYDEDVIAWANQQAEFLRSKQLSELDLENLAEEILDVGKSEQRELRSRMRVLLAHLIKWQYQVGSRSAGWEKTIKIQRKDLLRHIRKVPSLKHSLIDSDWVDGAWGDAQQLASKETGIDVVAFPDECPWTMEQALDDEFWPDESAA